MDKNIKLCRACLKTEEFFNYTLFDNVPPHIFTFCTSIEVQENEQLPKNVCDPCYESLIKYFDFKQICLQSQNALLLSCGDDMKKESEINYFITSNEIKSEDYGNNDQFNDSIFEQNLDSVHGSDLVKIEGLSWDKYNKTDSDTADFKKRIKNKQKNNKLKIKKPGSNCKHKKIYICKICDKKFKFKDSLDHHLQEHDGIVLPKSCKQCNKNFITWSGLRRHIENDHTIVKLISLRCPTCGKICKNKTLLKMHVKQQHQINNKEHVCDICGKSFTKRLILMEHFGTHNTNRERSFTCAHCGKKFFTDKHLKNHQSRCHTNSEQRFICHICSYPFTQKHNLAKHILACHEGQKPYKCDICLKSYTKQSSLLEHKRTHSGEKPFHCEYCSKSFISKRRLMDHHKIHTGERPHQCTLCNQSFTQRGTLVRHMKVHDKIVPALL